MRRHVLAGIVSVALAGHAAAQERPHYKAEPTVEAVLPGCHSLLAHRGVPTTAGAGFCSGLVDGLVYLGTILSDDLCFMVPFDVPQERVVAAIVEELEPLFESVKRQHFRALAIEVLGYKWPCYLPARSVHHR